MSQRSVRWMWLGMAALLGLGAGLLQSQEPFDHNVRNDFFAGFMGDQAALERAMKACESTLAENPKHAEAMVWHGGGTYFLAGRGDTKKGMDLAIRSLKEMDDAAACGQVAGHALITSTPWHVFWKEHYGSVRFACLITVVIGVGSFFYEMLQYRLERATLDLRTRELERERALTLATEARLASLESRVGAAALLARRAPSRARVPGPGDEDRRGLLNVDYVHELHPWFAGRWLVRLKDGKQTELTVARDRVRALKGRLGL